MHILGSIRDGEFFATCMNVAYSTPLSDYVFYVLLLFAHCNILIMPSSLHVIYTSYIVDFGEILMINSF